jgi:hypothetical protein
MRFTISRKTWLRGEGGKDSYLLRARDGKMCCLGSICLQGGLSSEQIRGRAEPATVDVWIKSDPKIAENLGWLLSGYATLDKKMSGIVPKWLNASSLTTSMMRVNDADANLAKDHNLDPITDAEREAYIIALAAEAGQEVEFVE